jgi:SAM-dependent methyltransferase
MSITWHGSVTQRETRVQEKGQLVVDPRIAFFDHHAPAWDNDAGEVARTLKRLDELREQVGLVSGQDVLEVGCGTGRVTGWIAETVRPGRVVATDFSPAMLAQAKARDVPAEFRLVDICGEVAVEERFDAVLCFHSFPHFRDQLRALRNIRNLLKPGGRLVILHLAGSAELNAFHAQLSHPVCHDHLPPAELWPSLLTQTGLRFVSVTDETGLFLLKASSEGCE